MSNHYQWQQLAGGFWVVAGDTRDLKFGDEITISKKDGTSEKRIVRRVQSKGERGLCVVCARNTPPVKVLR